jgi:serine/threonine-protein kinase
LLQQALDGDSLGRSGDGGPAATLELPPGAGGASVLGPIAAAVGPVPRVLLRDTDTGPEAPVVRVGWDTTPDHPGPAARLQILGEIARGGMGVVLKGRDTDLGRDLAVKVLLESHKDNPDLVHRFVEEAQIAGQLQHPGVVPVHELGTFADNRPYFSMKLVKGRTLASLLDERTSSAHEQPRLVGIFEAVCQTVAYAHARGVIHRDLKPSNVMVGSFGEVQVMDWGLAKVLVRGGAADDASAGKLPADETVISISTPRSGSDSDLSAAGSVMGTPAYMAPEQARGEVDVLDERCDVFALGSILCEILTGLAAVTGRTSAEIQRKAARGDLADALARLDRCGAEADLIALARDCLAAEAGDRPRDAGAVAGRLASYLASIRERMRAAELERARAETLAAEERTRRRLQLGLAAAVLALVVVGGGGAAILASHRQREAARVELALTKATLLRDQAIQAGGDLVLWARAAETARGAADGARASGDAALRRRADAIRAEVERASTLLTALVEIGDDAPSDLDGLAPELAYAAAFRAAGFDPDALGAAEAGARIERMPAPIARVCASALDDWAALRRGRRHDPAGARRLVAVASAADPDPWRARLREALGQADRGVRLAALRGLAQADDGEVDALPATSLGLLGAALAESGAREAAVDLLRRAQLRHPGHVRLHYELARVLNALARPEEAIEHYTTARAIRPTVAHELAHALARRGRIEEAISVFRDLVDRRPTNGIHAVCLGGLLQQEGRGPDGVKVLEAAIAASRRAIEARPDDAIAYQTLGLALWLKGKRDDAIAAFHTTIRLMPGETAARIYIARNAYVLGRHAQAVEVLHEAVRLRDDAEAWTILGYVLTAMGRINEAGAALSTAARLGADSWEFDAGIAGLFQRRRRWRDGADEYERARLNSSRPGDDPGIIGMPGHRSRDHHGIAWYFSAVAQLRAGRIVEYRALCRDMLQLNRGRLGQHELLARVCLMCPDDPAVVVEAATLAERALEKLPANPYARYTAGLAAYRLGRYESALERIRASRAANETAQMIIFRDAYRALTDLVEAMALERLGLTGAAAEALARAERLMANNIPAEGSAGLYPGEWQEWAHCEIIHREADAVVRWGPIFPANPFAP